MEGDLGWGRGGYNKGLCLAKGYIFRKGKGPRMGRDGIEKGR